MSSIDRSSFTRRELEIVYACTMGVLQACNRDATPWGKTIQAKLRARVMTTPQIDDDACPPLQDAVPYPVPTPSRQSQERRRPAPKGANK